jgi:hypothetical protein
VSIAKTDDLGITMPVCAAAAIDVVLAASVVVALDGLDSTLALAEELLIRARANNADNAREEMVSVANNFFVFVFIIFFCPFPGIGIQSFEKRIFLH